MKKSAKKLELRTEVVRALRAGELRDAAGGYKASAVDPCVRTIPCPGQ